DWVFGDFQSLKPNPDEHRIQPIGASHLEASGPGDRCNSLFHILRQPCEDCMTAMKTKSFCR
ncbi:hypothetical protein EIM05_17445, partial [Pseudomonas aeruginosa]